MTHYPMRRKLRARTRGRAIIRTFNEMPEIVVSAGVIRHYSARNRNERASGNCHVSIQIVLSGKARQRENLNSLFPLCRAERERY
jgi:hypothetical protein